MERVVSKSIPSGEGAFKGNSVSGKLTVKRSVYNAAQELKEIAESSGWKVIALAESKMDESQVSKDKAKLRFWRDVWIYLIAVSYLDTEAEIVEDLP